MPCYSPPHSYCQHSKGICHEQDESVKKHINYLTDLLCNVLTELEKASITPVYPELMEWWKKHKEFDKKRKEEIK